MQANVNQSANAGKRKEMQAYVSKFKQTQIQTDVNKLKQMNIPAKVSNFKQRQAKCIHVQANVRKGKQR